MADTHFDLSFDGTLAPGADPASVRQRLGSVFKLDERGIARLFTGKPVFVRRDVDAEAAAKFERVFTQAGAVLRVTPSEPADTPDAGTASSPPAKGGPPQGTANETAALSLAPWGGFIEEPPEVKMPDLDTSHLSLVSAPDWSLEDCEPTVTAAQAADISHLSLTELDTTPNQERSD